ncbi:MAG: hypothetical protein CL661_10230 [Bacteroidetes bacterium]|jgi:hypothetical protein|nr:hypothetical protein [Bacteroidota bacterium]
MKFKLFTTMCLVAILTVSVFSQTDGSTNKSLTTQITEKGNTISWESRTYDFKTVEQNKPAIAEFVFTNTSSEPISISRVKSSCGCTVTGYDKAPILPGQESKITATYNSRKPGSFRKSISVFMSDNSQFTLNIKGKVEAKGQLTKKDI